MPYGAGDVGLCHEVVDVLGARQDEIEVKGLVRTQCQCVAMSRKNIASGRLAGVDRRRVSIKERRVPPGQVVGGPEPSRCAEVVHKDVSIRGKDAARFLKSRSEVDEIERAGRDDQIDG